MPVLLISGLGPFRSHQEHLNGTLLGRDYDANVALQQLYAQMAGRPVDLRKLTYGSNGSAQPLLRARGKREPCLSTMTMQAVLEAAGADYDQLDIEALWYDGGEPPRSRYDVVAISTTFLVRRSHMRDVMKWVNARFPDATVVVGGQYSNLKYASILRDEPGVDYIIRGDAEAAFPALLRALDGKGRLEDVPNLVSRGPDGTPVMNRFEYIDIEAHPSPTFLGEHRTVPYESMRGCPFTCKYCSFPAASPKWRFKSAEKIVADWKRYAGENGATLIAALDSTFTIPPARLRRLMDLLPEAGVPWYSYSRANTINSKELVRQLEASACRGLAIGFESMNDKTLLAMDKKVTADENRRAYDLLNGSKLLVNGSFIVGYPGETPDDYEDTHAFIARELSGRFSLSVFSLTDETMPVWEDAARYELVETDEGWRHSGMTQQDAMRLLGRTILAARWENEDAVMITWQVDFATPLASGLGIAGNRRVEKLIERLTFLPRDIGTGPEAAERVRAMLAELEAMGVRMDAAETEVRVL